MANATGSNPVGGDEPHARSRRALSASFIGKYKYTWNFEMKRIDENTKVTLTVGQLKKLIKESDPNSLEMSWKYVSTLNTLNAIDETLGEVIDILNDWRDEMDHALYSKLWDRVDRVAAWVMELKEAAKKEEEQ